MSRTTTDHVEIRNWAESKGGKPAAVKRTRNRNNAGIVRIMFPDAPQSENDNLEEISWYDFFREFDTRQLALVYDDNSLFSKIVGRDTAEQRKAGNQRAAR